MNLLRTIAFGLAALAGNTLAADKPNFVWILSEDNSIHYLNHFFEGGAETPNIETMAAEGLTFNNAFSNAPVCSVARTTLITGCYAPRIGTQFHRKSVTAAMPEGLRMFPAYLRDAGYYTTNNAKTDYNAKASGGVWNESSNKAHWRNRKEGQPFFHKVTYATSHEGQLHFSENKMKSTKTQTDPASVTLAPYHPDTPTFRYTYATYHDKIKAIDVQVGKVIDQLRKDGLLENTFVFYFGDHGGVLPRGKGYAYESGLHVPLVVRIPDKWQSLVDVKRGARTDGFVSFIDFGPTLLNLAGLTVPEQMDGHPFLGKGISSAELAARDEVFGYADRFDEKYDLVRTLRVGDFEYVRNYQPFNFDGMQNDYRYQMAAYREWRKLFKAGKLNATQSQFFQTRPAEMLFNIAKDPHEVNDLSGDSEHKETLLKLRSRLSEIVKSMPDLSFYPEPFLAKNAIPTNAVAFGQKHKDEIASLVDLADLQLGSFEAAKEKLRAALKSDDATTRYWACIVASTFGKNATPLTEVIANVAKSDKDPLVRTRAAEFLGLTKAGDPVPAIMASLKMSDSPITTNLILNSAVMLHDGEANCSFKSITPADVNQSDRYINDRVAWLSGKPTPARSKKKPRKAGSK